MDFGSMAETMSVHMAETWLGLHIISWTVEGNVTLLSYTKVT